MVRHRVVARNWATESENKIHADETARRYGFRGGLVPGVALYAYLVAPIVEQWGMGWVGGGWASVRFVKPVYEGDEVTVSADGDGRIELLGVDGEVCAAGEAGAGRAPEAPPVIPAAPLPVHRPPAGPGSLAQGTVLGSVDHHFWAAESGEYLASIGVDDWPDVAHPGWLLRDANTALVANVRLGPWIHVGSRVQHLAAVADGQLISTRSRVTANYERKGHRFVDLDVVGLADDRPAFVVAHTAIWEPRPS